MVWLRRLIFTVAAAIGITLIVGAAIFGGEIPFAHQWPLYEALRNTAAIIFAVVGAWLAIIYPERLKLSFGEKAKSSNSSTNFKILLAPAINSTFILVILLIVGVAVPILKRMPHVGEFPEFFRSASFILLTVLTLWQIITVIIAVVPIEMLLNQASDDDAKKKLDSHYGSRHQQL